MSKTKYGNGSNLFSPQFQTSKRLNNTVLDGCKKSAVAFFKWSNPGPAEPCVRLPFFNFLEVKIDPFSPQFRCKSRDFPSPNTNVIQMDVNLRFVSGVKLTSCSKIHLSTQKTNLNVNNS